MYAFHELLLPEEFAEAENLLRQRGLALPKDIDLGLGAYEENSLIGAGFLSGSIICGIGVAARHEGLGLSAAIVSALINRAAAKGIHSLRLFTKSAEAKKFAALGFSLCVKTDSAVLLELGYPNYSDWIHLTNQKLTHHADGVPASKKDCSRKIPLGAVIMNANPFTLGHRYVVEKTLEHSSRAVVFVVEEDLSAFPLQVRSRLVTEGLRDLEKAVVLPGGPYMVSRASFPSYFTGKEDHARVHAELDCTLFAERIAPDLGIGLRVVGTEPYCPVTAMYNEALRRILPQNGIICLEVPRLVTGDGATVSASHVRARLAEKGGDASFADMVPASTAAFLSSDEAEVIRKSLKKPPSRH